MLAELRKAWDESKPHIEIATLCDWFASYVFLAAVGALKDACEEATTGA